MEADKNVRAADFSVRDDGLVLGSWFAESINSYWCDIPHSLEAFYPPEK